MPGSTLHKTGSAIPQKGSIADVAKVSIREFLHRMNVALPRFSRDAELEARVKAITRTWPFEQRIRRHIVTGLVITEASYPHVSDIEARVAIAIYTALLTAVDTPELFDAVGAQDFYQRICDGSLRDDRGMLGEFVRVIMNMGQFYSSFCASSIFSSTLRFLNGELIGNPESKSFVEPNSKAFVDFSRGMNGDAEAYAAFIWSKGDLPGENTYIQVFPDACLYINHANDILSFYKEEQDGEVASYIHARARITGRSTIATLREVIDEVVAASERIRRTLGEGPAREAWDSFERGYIRFHVGDPRYRLQDIIGAHWEYMIDATTF
ncbi:isoprenoid synthase domain-containing protein [Fomitopsis serialis]|uniref:isoprenoid synthase domain-containing protein n=1 Tax=Fomitopsis serialis TaxID=139415 RepID=UPI0020089DE1|nr:isoprenoid synthase domain-containing protein [Neoantrodia serialis]KAH9926482.1 isoprenoid synthase domain-containing protein [Neoantrodia serialis]